MMADYTWQLAPDSGMGVAIYGSGYKEGVFDKYSWPLFRGDQVSILLFSVAKFLTRLLSTRRLRILFDPIYNCGTDPLSCQGLHLCLTEQTRHAYLYLAM